MRFRFPLGIALMFSAALAQSLELPEWHPDERKTMEAAGWIAGEALLGGETQEAPVENPDGKPALDLEEDERENEAEISREVPEKLWTTYFDQRPPGFLLDPQNVLASNIAHDRLAFLQYHSKDSSIDLYVYIFKGDQIIPGEVREEEIAERFFTRGKPAVVLLYFMGAPQRTIMHLSPSLTDAVPTAEQHRALESSVMEAFKRLDHPGQLEGFLVQMSIRIYWMERMLSGSPAPQQAAAAAPLPAGISDPEAEGKLMRKLGPFFNAIRPYRLPLAIGVPIVLGLLAAWWFCSAKARLRFPEIEVEPRLGGAHGAGVGAVISFASATVSPSSQRDQVPDYLRRM